ncbi:hypothetical protein Tco_1400948 [Tanacetum coccineum]
MYAYLKQHESYVNENKMMLERYTQHTIDPLALVSNVSPQQFPTESLAILLGRQNKFQGNNTRGAVVARNRVTELAMQILVKQSLSSGQDNNFDDDVDEPPVQDLALNVDQVFQADQCDAFDVDEAPTAQTMFMENLSSTDPIYDEVGPSYDSDILSEKKVAIGYKNPLYLTSAIQVQSALYNGHEIVKTNHALDGVHDSEDTLELAKITRKKMLEKMKSPQCIEKKIKIAPPDYSKENYLAIFTPHRQLSTEQIFWSSISKSISELIVYPPNTSVKLAPKVLSTKKWERGFEQTKECYLTKVILFFQMVKEHFEGIQMALIKEVKEIKEIFEQMEAEVKQNVMDKKCAKIERKNLLIENVNLIADCLSNALLYSVMNSVNMVSRFCEMHAVYTVEQARNVNLEAKISKLKHKIQKDDHSEMIKHFSNLEVMDIQEKDKNRSQNNKTEHEKGKSI